MSLLSNLTLSYENLADDPIDVGIHYGHSILGALSAKLVPHFPEPVLEAASSHSYRAPMPQSVARSASYVPRGFKARATQGYTPRTLVGTI